MIYALSFLASIALLYISKGMERDKSVVLVVIAIAIPCLLAAFRDSSVGTDVEVWGIWVYQSARKMPLIPFLEAQAGEAAIGFNLLAWLGANLGGGMAGYLGLIQLATVLPFMLAVKKVYPEHLWIGMTFYLLFIFPPSLNVMKQMIAVSIAFYGIVFILSGSLIKYFVCILIALMFHQTAIVALPIYPIVRYVIGDSDKEKNSRKIKMIAIVTAIAFAAVFCFGERLVLLLSALKESYANEVDTLGKGDFNWSIMVLLVGVTMTCCAVYARSEASIWHDNKMILMLYLFVCGCLLFELGVISPALSRFSYYGTSFLSLVMCGIYEKQALGKKGFAVLCLILAAYFVFNYVVRGAGEIYPYSFAMFNC